MDDFGHDFATSQMNDMQQFSDQMMHDNMMHDQMMHDNMMQMQLFQEQMLQDQMNQMMHDQIQQDQIKQMNHQLQLQNELMDDLLFDDDQQSKKGLFKIQKQNEEYNYELILAWQIEQILTLHNLTHYDMELQAINTNMIIHQILCKQQKEKDEQNTVEKNTNIGSAYMKDRYLSNLMEKQVQSSSFLTKESVMKNNIDMIKHLNEEAYEILKELLDGISESENENSVMDFKQLADYYKHRYQIFKESRPILKTSGGSNEDYDSIEMSDLTDNFRIYFLEYTKEIMKLLKVYQTSTKEVYDYFKEDNKLKYLPKACDYSNDLPYLRFELEKNNLIYLIKKTVNNYLAVSGLYYWIFHYTDAYPRIMHMFKEYDLEEYIDFDHYDTYLDNQYTSLQNNLKMLEASANNLRERIERLNTYAIKLCFPDFLSDETEKTEIKNCRSEIALYFVRLKVYLDKLFHTMVYKKM